MTSTAFPMGMARPPSEQLVDLHVYLVPKDAWNEKYHSAYNDVIHHTISAGFVRVWPELSLYYLRNHILEQLGTEVVPDDYVFLKSVGRCLTQVKSKQEFELKVKNFIPPQVALPEIFVLESQRDGLNLSSFTNHERMELNGGIPPLEHLETRKAEDSSSTPIKSGRLDTYTNNTNEDSGVAELTPERTQLEYGRQQSDSSERKQEAENHQTPRALTLDSRERPDSISQSLSSTTGRQPDKVPKDPKQAAASPEQAKRSRQKASRGRQRSEKERRIEDEARRERQRSEKERRIEDEARREQEEKQKSLEAERQREKERWEKEKQMEEERQRLLKARQNEIDKRRLEVAVAQKAKAAAAEEAARQQRLKDEEEEREMEEEIRKRQADELRQSRQMSWEQARQRERSDQFTPQSHGDVRSQQRDLYNGSATGDSLDQRRTKGTRQSEGPQDDLASLAEETGSGTAADGRDLGSDGGSPGNASGTNREKMDAERERLLAELKEKQDMRFDLERTREELMRQAKTLQSRTVDRRNKARDFWKKKYFEEKKRTNPLEETVNKLRAQMDQQHRRLLNQLEGRGPNRKGMPREPPSKKNDHKILIFKLRHQMEDLRRRVENSKMKLTSEIKLRNQAEAELRGLRGEVLQRKIHVTVSRTQQLNTPQEPEDKLKGLTMRGTGATSNTPRGNLKTGLK